MSCDKKTFIDNDKSILPRANVTVLGGDMRALAAAKRLIRRGLTVTLCGFSDADTYPRGAILCATLKNAVSNANVLLLPIPVSRDGVHLFCPLDRCLEIKLEDIAGELQSSVAIFGGGFPEKFKSSLSDKGFPVFDFLDDPSLALLNAHATAEGALMYAMEATDTTLFGRNIAVIGYGKIAERLCRLCLSFGANVTVFARREESRMLTRLHGADALPLTPEHARTLSHGFDIIFNTVPARIIPKETARALPSDTLYMELASAPFGIDAEDARSSSAKVIWAASIPGKYAPVTSGEAIAGLLLSRLEGGARE